MIVKETKGKGKPIIYINEEIGKGVILNGARVIHAGSIKIKNGKYRYFQYRLGKKVIHVYIGKVR